MLYDKRSPAVLAEEAVPTDTAAESSDCDISSDSVVTLLMTYTADGTGKTLRVYPEVRLVLPGGEQWIPALSASLDVGGATIDAEGYLPLPAAAPILEVPGISGVEVRVPVQIPVLAGDRFRCRYLEDGYSAPEPAQVSLIAMPARGAS